MLTTNSSQPVFNIVAYVKEVAPLKTGASKEPGRVYKVCDLTLSRRSDIDHVDHFWRVSAWGELAEKVQNLAEGELINVSIHSESFKNGQFWETKNSVLAIESVLSNTPNTATAAN